jgi:hypothetical protein
MAIARIDAAAAVRESRMVFDHLGDRRPEAYGPAGHAAAVAAAAGSR